MTLHKSWLFGPKLIKISFKWSQPSLESITQAWNLTMILDVDLTVQSHINSIVKTRFYHLINIAKVSRFLSQENAEKLIHDFYIQSARMHRNIQKASWSSAATPECSFQSFNLKRKYNHITALLRSLHWLLVNFRIDFKF